MADIRMRLVIKLLLTEITRKNGKKIEGEIKWKNKTKKKTSEREAAHRLMLRRKG